MYIKVVVFVVGKEFQFVVQNGCYFNVGWQFEFGIYIGQFGGVIGVNYYVGIVVCQYKVVLQYIVVIVFRLNFGFVNGDIGIVGKFVQGFYIDVV